MDAWPNDKIQIMDSEQGIIAEVLCHTSCGTTEDNSRVIAAAPELLAALERVLNCPDLNLDELEPETLNARREAWTVIHKARGEG